MFCEYPNTRVAKQFSISIRKERFISPIFTHFTTVCFLKLEYLPYFLTKCSSLQWIIFNVEGSIPFSSYGWTEASLNSLKLSLQNWYCYTCSTRHHKPPYFPELKARGPCHPFFFSPPPPSLFLTNGTLQESRKCQHILQPRSCFKQWHKTKRLIVFLSKHTSHRHHAIHTSFLVPQDRTGGPAPTCSSHSPGDKVCRLKASICMWAHFRL